MAQFTAQGRVKLLFNGGDGVSLGMEPPSDPFHLRVRSIQPHKRKFKLSGSTTRLYSSSSSSSFLNRPPDFTGDAHLNGGDEVVGCGYAEDDGDHEFSRDELS